MKKKATILAILGIASLSLIFASSNKQDCSVDQAFTDTFNKHVNVLKNFALVDFDTEEIDNVLSSVGYLNAVTEIPSQIYLGDAVLYGRKEFKQDRKKWNKWYKDNKCSMTETKADSLHQANVDLRPDINN